MGVVFEIISILLIVNVMRFRNIGVSCDMCMVCCVMSWCCSVWFLKLVSRLVDSMSGMLK